MLLPKGFRCKMRHPSAPTDIHTYIASRAYICSEPRTKDGYLFNHSRCQQISNHGFLSISNFNWIVTRSGAGLKLGSACSPLQPLACDSHPMIQQHATRYGVISSQCSRSSNHTRTWTSISKLRAFVSWNRIAVPYRLGLGVLG